MANITTQTIRVDLSTDKILPTAFTHQNDTARTFEFSIYNKGVPYTMTGNTVKFAYKSPIVDGQYSVIAGSSMASGTVSGNKVTVTLPVAYTQISGVGMLTMVITPTSGTVRPVNIRLVVQKSADGADTVSGASDFPATLEQIADNWYDENIADWLNENVETIFDAEAFGTAIDTWLDDHPEATTTVQDGSITYAKLNSNINSGFVLDNGTYKYDYNGLVNKPTSDDTLSVEGGFADAKKVGEKFDTIGQSISPIYLGDFMMSYNEQHGCSMRIDGKIYSFVSSTTETTNTGRGLVFDLDANSKIMEKSILVGHANSCAYDSENDIIYVVPIWDYENNKAAVNYIYKYDTDLNYIGVEETNFVAVGISYDPITKTLYAKSGGATGVNKTLYKKNENEWVAVGAIPTIKHEDNIYNITYNQDLAVYDSKIYLSSSHRSVAVGVIKESEVEIFSGFACSKIDSMAMFKLGELEGMEFDTDGHLIVADYIQTSSNSKNAYVLEIPTRITLPQIPNVTGSVWDEITQFNLTSATQSKFALSRKEIRSFAQIRSKVFVPPAINITGGSGLDDPYFVRVFEDIAVVLSGIYNVGRFDIYAGTLEFYITTSGATVNTPSSYSFGLLKLGKLKFGGSQPLTVSSGNLSNVISNDGSYTIIDVAPVVENGSFRISSSIITETGIYRNATKILAY